MDISIIFPPPGAQNVLFMQYCMNLKRVILLLSHGNICLYSFDRTGLQDPILEHVHNEQDIVDSDHRKMK